MQGDSHLFDSLTRSSIDRLDILDWLWQGLSMRILHLCDSLNPAGLGGYEAILHYLSAELVSEGHESFVATQPPAREFSETITRSHYTLFHLPGNLLEARKWEFYALPEDERSAAAEQLFTPEDLNQNVSSLIEQLGRLLLDVRPDVIHAHSTYVVFNRVLEVLQQDEEVKNIPAVVSIHGLPKPLILPDGTDTTDYAQFASHMPFDLVLAVSDNVAETLREHLSPENLADRVTTLRNAVNLSVFSPRQGIDKQWDIAFLGRLETMKAVDLFPEMLLQLKQGFPELRMLMTGDGSYKDTLLQGLEEKGVSEMVDYLGVVETERVPDLINRSRIFLYPSRREPFGLSIIEAMACAVPVVTTNVYGPGEIVTHGEDGLAVPPGEVDPLVEAIGALLSDEELQSKLGKNARRTVESHYDLREHTKMLLDIYRVQIEKKRGSGT
jgi:glycosyltransferase involved in cell wall biosynthesis